MNKENRELLTRELLEFSKSVYGSADITFLSSLIRNSVHSMNFRIFRDSENQIDSFVIWANVNSDTLRQIRDYSIFPKYTYEWNEGKCVLLLAVIARTKLKRNVIKFLTQKSRETRFISYIRKNKLKIVYRKRTLNKD